MKKCTTQHLINQHLLDINPILAGWSKNWDAPPIWDKKRCSILLFYVHSGAFTLVSKDKEYTVEREQAFFIPLSDHTSYTKPINDTQTYDYCWVGFTGALSHRFAPEIRIIDIAPEQLIHLKELHEFTPHTAYDLASDILLLRSSMFDEEEPKHDHIQTVIDYIQQTYMLPITAESIAAQVGLDRSYLSRLFKQKTGQTLQNYLQLVRLQEAKHYLVQGYSVREAAYRCGFSGDKNFYKLFLQREGITPVTWKKCMLENLSTLQNKWPDEINDEISGKD